MNALRSAWIPTTRQRGRPFAFAVWTYACPSSSIIDERAIIVSLPTAGSASVSAGRIEVLDASLPGRGQELELDREEQDQEDPPGRTAARRAR